MISEYLANLVLAQLEGKIPGDLPQGISVEEIVDISHRNQMDYLLLGALVKVNNISEEQRKWLRSRVIVSVIRTTNQIVEMKKLENALEEGKIKNQPMKGALMKFMYPSPEMREMSDIDILVDTEKMDDVAIILKGLGYTLQQSIKHHDIYVKEPFMVAEMHKSLYDKTVDGGQYKYFSNFERTIKRDGFEYSFDFTKEDFYVYMLAHMAKHFYTMGCGIRNLVDVYIFLKKYQDTIDRKYITEELEKCGILEFAQHIEKLADIWLNGGKNNAFYQELFQYMQDSGIYGKDENGIWNKFAEEKMKNKDVSITQLKRWYYFPPVSYMAEYYPWLEEHAILLPVAWGVRFYRGLFKKKGVYKREMLHEIEQSEIKCYQRIYQKMGLHFKR